MSEMSLTYIGLSNEKVQPGQRIVVGREAIMVIAGRNKACVVVTPAGVPFQINHGPRDVLKACDLEDEMMRVSANAEEIFVRADAVLGVTGGPSSAVMHFVGCKYTIALPAINVIRRLEMEPVEIEAEEEEAKPVAPPAPPLASAAPVTHVERGPVAGSQSSYGSPTDKAAADKAADEKAADEKAEAKKEEANAKRRKQRADAKNAKTKDTPPVETDASEDEEDDEPPAPPAE